MDSGTVTVRRRDTTKGPPLRILSLDGGGVRGYSMLVIIQELMYRIYVECEGKAPRRDQIPKPCDHFDLIVGSGTGGLIALMLGRLRLDLETCKDVYVRMTRRVFETDKTFAGIPYRHTLFKASKLEEAIRECVREHTIFESEGNDMSDSAARDSLSTPMFSPASAPHRSLSRSSASSRGLSSPSTPIGHRSSLFVNGLRWGNPDTLLYDSREYRTKTAVTAVYKGTTRPGLDILLRSYDSRKEPPPEFNCTIWQAGRATCATGLAFKPIQIGQHFFTDEGPGTFNPSPLVLDEATVNEWPGREVGVFVSIGTGKRPPGTNHRQHEWWESFFGDSLGIFAEARRRLISKIENCENVHQDMLREHLAKRNVSQDNYFRLNVEVGVGEFGMNEWSRLADISTSTRRYLSRPEVKKSILSAGVKFAKIERMHRRLAARGNVGGVSTTSDNEEDIVLSPQAPSFSVPPPSNPIAIELPAEVPMEYVQAPAHPLSPSPHSSHAPLSPTSNVLSTHPTSQETTYIPGRYSASDVSNYPVGGHGSPRHSADAFINAGPPPVPPKTPIPYPEDPDDVARVALPVVPLPEIHPLNITKEKVTPPYPVDEPPPVVNRQRKPSYHVR
ncbi:hypothetical protein MPDQ_007367 [Monascus purpureus]|uniref:PNPLA domain-containing protein n=1 Tax=Monascus purpureus TaxID=5098 RepID=A0A507QWD0_MONPU|nr:hypothetical protein MPDQ_007367 [Monascus purpureus]BDD63168.1 hypothetical protein MAP00_008100 [Monascus purpureus]